MGTLLIVIVLTTVFQAYVLRIRHNIVGFYFPEQSKERVVSLYNEIIRERKTFAVHMLEKVNKIRKQNSQRCSSAWLYYSATLRNQLAHCLKLPKKCIGCARRVECFASQTSCPNDACEVVYFCPKCEAVVGWNADIDTCVCDASPIANVACYTSGEHQPSDIVPIRL